MDVPHSRSQLTRLSQDVVARLRQSPALRLRRRARGQAVRLRAQGREGRQGVPAAGPVGDEHALVVEELGGWDEGGVQVALGKCSGVTIGSLRVESGPASISSDVYYLSPIACPRQCRYCNLGSQRRCHVASLQMCTCTTSGHPAATGASGPCTPVTPRASRSSYLYLGP